MKFLCDPFREFIAVTIGRNFLPWYVNKPVKWRSGERIVSKYLQENFHIWQRNKNSQVLREKTFT